MSADDLDGMADFDRRAAEDLLRLSAEIDAAIL